MALKPISISNLKTNTHFSNSPSIISFHPSSNPTPKKTHIINRRMGLKLIASMTSSMAVTMFEEAANGFEMKFVAPEQSLEEAERGVKAHAEALLEVKELIEKESWKEAQKSIRSNSPFLKRDIRTIIQYKAAAERPILRKLFSVLFNNVTRLDYAARDKDAERVWQCYNNMEMALSDILSRI